MNPNSRPYDEAELEAYVDGELDPVRSAEIAAWLSVHPTAQAAAETIRYQNAGLRALFDGLLEEPVPLRLQAALGQRRKRRVISVSRVPWYGWAAACVLLMVASLAAGWVGHERSVQQQQREQRIEAFLDQVQSAYALYSIGEVRTTIDEERLNRMLSMVTERLNAEIRRPRRQEGYRLLDGRLIPTPGSIAAVFLISDPQDRRISLYVQGSWEPNLAGAHLAHRDDLSFYYWTDGPLTYALAAPVEQGYLRELGARLYPHPE